MATGKGQKEERWSTKHYKESKR